MMKVTYQVATDVGRRRKGNEDYHLGNPEQQLYVVADGMGGHAAGEVASHIAVEAINEFICLTSGDKDVTWPFDYDGTLSHAGNRIKTAIQHANRRVVEGTQERADYEGMATTVVAVLVAEGAVNIAHVGDSRAYQLRSAELAQLTSDHSWVNEQITSGVISPDQARTHPLRNVVTRALGSKVELRVDVRSLKPEVGDVLLLCTDGLTTMLPDAEIKEVLLRCLPNLERAARELIDAANEHGGEDNVTVLLLRFES
jgi:serine/threonine protein phosphatase PrpC